MDPIFGDEERRIMREAVDGIAFLADVSRLADVLADEAYTLVIDGNVVEVLSDAGIVLPVAPFYCGGTTLLAQSK